ncbi:MAG TPA: glycosyl transferase family 2 [Syntrophaceae bacterium]|nr:glycosyl transferase family 2 [Syntrophaceae bacterium]
MDVSIVIVSFSTNRLLDECIESIKKETCCSHEIIVVDNASADDSCRMLREKYPDVILIENAENAGFARANNQGFAIAQGRYFFMLNPDTLILDGAINKLLDFMEKNPDIGICGPRNIGRDGKMQYNCDHFPSVWNSFCYFTRLGDIFPRSRFFNPNQMRYWNYAEIRDVDRMVGCSLMIRSGLYKDLHGLDENFFMYFEETDFCHRAKKSGARITYYPHATILHYGGESSKTTPNEPVISNTVASYFHKSLYYYYRKNHNFFSLITLRLLNLTFGLFLLLRSSISGNGEKRNMAFCYGRFLIRVALARR